MSVYDAAVGGPIQLIHTRHEAAAVHMADASGRLLGRAGVALVTAGPGFANCLSALYVAKEAEAPLVLLSGDSPLEADGRGPFQELSQVAMARPVTKATWRVEEAERVATEVERALELATRGRPGPVHLSLPVDVLEREMEERKDSLTQGVPQPLAGMDERGARRAVDTLARARRPLVILGPAAIRSEGGRRLLRSSPFGLTVIGMESPRGVLDPALGALSEIIGGADLYVLVGRKLDAGLAASLGAAARAGQRPRYLQFDADAEAIGKGRRNASSDEHIVQVLTERVVEDADRAIREAYEIADWDGAWQADIEAAVTYRPREWQEPDRREARTASLLREVDEYLNENSKSILISDGGEFGQWVQACVRGGTRVINGPSGAVGGAVAFALGARSACPDARIVALMGDGAFGFHALEFDTAVRYDLPITVIIGNDAAWNAELQIQMKRFGPERTYGCELLPTRYDQLVAALGGVGRMVTTVAELRAALREPSVRTSPTCINMRVERLPAPSIRRK